MNALQTNLPESAKIGVFAPSGVFNEERFEAGLETIREWGFEPVLAPNVGKRHRYLAGSDQDRLDDLVWALTERSLAAAWMVRGGYGLTRLLVKVPWERAVNRPVLGFSDGTALHVALRQCAGIHGIHAPVIHSLSSTGAAPKEALRRLLQEGITPDLIGHELSNGQGATASGPVVGGNLCMLSAICGTRWQLDATGSILLLEEVNEPPYKVDRMINQLKMSGVLDGVVGVAVGSLLGTNPPEGEGWSTEDLLLDLLSDLSVPIITGLPVGHGADNFPFVFGKQGSIESGRLVFSSAP
jgi:muramoyltetrapeptide carboxypeptidase